MTPATATTGTAGDASPHRSGTPTPTSEDGFASAVRVVFGVIFLWASGVHVGIVSGDPELYHDVADQAWVPGVRTAWREVFMAHPGFWGLLIAVGEFGIGAAVLAGGRAGRYGVVGAVAFHLGLMALGWGFWIWSLPALVLLLAPYRAHASVPRAPIDHRPGAGEP